MSLQPDHVVVTQLREALGMGRVPDKYQAFGLKLLENLSEPVRIVVLGRPGSGKSSIINMMIGEDILGPMPGLDIAEVCYGPTARTLLEWPNGTTRTMPGLMIEQHHSHGAFRVRFELPEDHLRTQSYCEINQPDDPDRQARLFQYALEHGQVFLWCTERFDDAELAIWSVAPDVIKDHSFLALTMADRHLMKGCLSERIDALQHVVAEEFLALHPIATLHALAARSGGMDQDELWESSGGRSLLEAVQSKVLSGRAEEHDQAMMIVSEFGRKNRLEVVSNPANALRELRGSATALRDDADTMGLVQRHIQSCADDLVEMLGQGRDPNPSDVMNQCARTLRDLTAILEEQSGDDNVSGLLDDMRDGEEVLMLLQVEQSETAAEDAVTLMFQLKKELNARTKS